ncbi:biotin synthase BioB [Chlamydia abortus]|uniref:biotin synthase BioB n=1 Tax=Chlamydia abortus TaxID=83555 RepID=UPI0011EF442F|nr:biotin synthase BioB [Chlamydia abortus]QEM74028.1 biotin synthase BioB [Chlamydia abortus]CAG9045911.1 Biotin synthase [Chlamydia abortus]
MEAHSELWSLEAIKEVYNTPIFELIHRANAILRSNFPHSELQTCYLVSIKTGGCTEDCAYCAQSSRYQTHVKPEPMMKITEVLDRAKQAIRAGATRVCLGAAWREVKDNHQFDRTLEMIKGITDMGAEVCCTLGMLTPSQAEKLFEAGLYAYNHNLDSSEGFYKTIITTRKYEDRLRTLDIVEKSGLHVCCGGIIGMGETVEDRVELLHNLARRERMPESVPVNVLWPIKGTPLYDQASISFWEILRTIATARIVFPQSMVRLAAGRAFLSVEQQTLCFIAGANSIFYGEKLLTVDNNDMDADTAMLNLLGMRHRPSFSMERGQPCQSVTC